MLCVYATSSEKAPITTNYCHLLCLLLVALKVTSANSVDPDQTAPLGALKEQTDLGPHCLPVCKKKVLKVCKNIQQTT